MTAHKRALLTVLVLLMAAPLVAGDEKADDSVTHSGFTGLFNVISPDTLNRGQVSFGVLYRNYDRELTDIDVNDIHAAFAIGVHDNVELGFSYSANRQMTFRDAFAPTFYNNNPAAQTTIENGGGDLMIGFKVALARMEEAGNGFAILGRVKVPTADEEQGRGTGGTDFLLGVTGGVERGQAAIYGNFGYNIISDTSSELGSIDLANMLTWGAGLEFGRQNFFRGIFEVTGESFVQTPGEPFPAQESAVELSAGFKLGGAAHGGLTFAAAYTRNLSMDGSLRPNGVMGELSFTSAPAPPLPPPPPPAINHDPTVTASASPKEVYPSFSDKTNLSTVTARASDPDGDSLDYTWEASGGRVTGSGPSVVWHPPEDVDSGTYTVTVAVKDRKGGMAEASDTIKVIPDPEWFDGRVLFGFDRYDLDDEDRAVIRKAADQLRHYSSLKLTLEGHTCCVELGRSARIGALRSAPHAAGVCPWTS